MIAAPRIEGVTRGPGIRFSFDGRPIVAFAGESVAAALLAALFYGVWTLALLGLMAGLAQALAKFSLDATIQRDIPTKVQASAFGRSDTTCQLAWVLGGFVGIALPLDPPRLGLTVAFVALAAWTVYVLSTAPRGRRRQRLGAQARARQADIDTQPMPVQRKL